MSTNSPHGAATRDGARFAGLRAGDRRAFLEVADESLEAFRSWRASPEPWPEERLDAFARRAFELQLRANRPYRLYCERRGVGPESVRGWREVPPVPTAAFREVLLCAGDPAAAAAVFRTSGTSRGVERRGRHAVPDLALYASSAAASFAAHVLVDGSRIRIGSLVPPFEPRRDSSLSWMADLLLDRFGAEGSRRLAGPAGFRTGAARAFVARARADGVPVCLLGTTLAFDAWTRRLEAEGVRRSLPPGSLLVDTGGAKGRPGLRRADVLERVAERLGIPTSRAVNEFGMTELLSQRYSRPAGPVERPPLYGPPWLRTRALDPVTLEELPEDRPGLLCHFDLANLGSVCAVLTEDFGRVRGGAVVWSGRAPGAPPRGCSIATAELLAAQEEG